VYRVASTPASSVIFYFIDKKDKAVPVTGRGGFWDIETPTFSLNNRLTDGGKAVSLTRRPPFTPPGTFLLEAASTTGP
jgi:hypothetical protein